MRAKNLVVVALSVAALVLASNSVAIATTGHALIAGKRNSADRTTTLSNSGKGPALSLKSKPGSASLAVSSSVKVLHLNADRVDGYEGARLNNDTYRFTDSDHTDASSAISLILPVLPAGGYQVAFTMFPEAGADATSTDPFEVSCSLNTGTDTKAAAASALTFSGQAAIVSGGDVVVLKPKAHVYFACDAGMDDFTVQDLRLSLTRTTVLKTTKLAPKN